MGSYYLTGTELKMEGWLDSNVNILDVIELHIENDYHMFYVAHVSIFKKTK